MKYHAETGYKLGWKSTLEHWNDDACWLDTTGVWRPLKYGGEHPMAPDTMDLAFAVTGQPQQVGKLTVKLNHTTPDHFWWPSDPDPDNEMISILGQADPFENIFWNSVTLQADGTGNDALDISAVKVWLDNNNDGKVDSGDTLLGTGAYPADNGTVTINLVPPPLILAGLTRSLVVSYTMSVSGNVIDTYYFDVTGASGTGQTSGLPVTVTIVPFPLRSATKYLGPAPISIGQAKQLRPGLTFLLSGKIVTAEFTANLRLFYIEEEGGWKYNGIGVNAGAVAIPPFIVGDHCEVYGTCSLLAGSELIVQPQVVCFSPGNPMSPVGINNAWTGGQLFGFQPSVLDDALNGVFSYALNNVGLLEKTWGEVTHRMEIPVPDGMGAAANVDAFWINDGSNLQDGFISTHGKIKWSQPPVHAEGYPPEFYRGWNEKSVWGSNKIVADDFLCRTPDPITDFHWWGSFIGWPEPVPPQLPDAFHIGIWTDFPAGAGFSHPARLLWQTFCTNYSCRFVGWNIDPREPLTPPEACFLFSQKLDPREAWQQQTGQGVYWISIAAVYWTQQPAYPWGWKTSPRYFQDDAVRIFNPTSWPTPPPWPQYISGQPIYWPVPENSWDTAFELTTSGYTKGVAVLIPPDAVGIPAGCLDVTGIMRAIPNPSGQPVRLLVPRTWSEIIRHK